MCFNLEAGIVFYQNYNWNNGQECFQNALEISDITFELTGAYGKRTKYQQKDLAQLLLKIKKKSDENNQNNGLASKNWVYFNQDLIVSELPKVSYKIILTFFCYIV